MTDKCKRCDGPLLYGVVIKRHENPVRFKIVVEGDEYGWDWTPNDMNSDLLYMIQVGTKLVYCRRCKSTRIDKVVEGQETLV